MKKVVKSNVVAQKWLWWSNDGKIFNNNNFSEFWCRFPVGGGSTNLPELLLLKILPLSDTTDTSGPPRLILQHFSCCLFAWDAPIFTIWLFLCRFNSYSHSAIIILYC